jgi:hypothetical protein
MTQKNKKKNTKNSFMMVVDMGKNDYGNVHIFTIIDLETNEKIELKKRS